MVRPSLDTIAALATPAGTSALALLRVSGPAVASLATSLFVTPLTPRQARHADYHDVSGRLLDDVVAIHFAGPNSATGEDTLEISCHGNPFIVQKILEDLFARGCRPAQPGEFTQRAFLSGRIDLTQAEAVMDLIQARSERALAAAQQQLRGSLGRRMHLLIEELVATLARLEAYIDFPEEDLPPEDRSLVEGSIDRLSQGTDQLLITSHFGEILRQGIKTVIIGEPNAGKSSLLNRMLGRDRAIVSPEPGTTRDFIEEVILVGPHCIRLIDTAGLNADPQPIERLGIAKTLELVAEADLFLLVIDSTHPTLPPLPSPLWARLHPDRTIVVVNKVDRLADKSAFSFSYKDLRSFLCSAQTGEGCDALRTEIGRLAQGFELLSDGELIAINARHADALSRARHSLTTAKEKTLAPSFPVELIASDLRAVLDALGEISGRVDNERVLDQLFSTFCIGK